ncbi:MAG: HAD hydrolase-like protein [Defluviitaleaceae bacterium]|nr:HAD hydrolase-like protein [Defluviitaleaceae bacterium]
MCDLVLFDMDGTLVDSQEGIINSIVYALDFFNIRVDDTNSLRVFLGPPLRDTFNKMFGFEGERLEQVVAKYREHLSDRGLYEGELYLGIIETLATLRENGVKMAVATAKATVFAKEMLEHYHIAKYFDLIVGCELDGRRSEKSEIIACVLDEIDNERTMKPIMIGDRKFDILGAKAHGIPSVGCLWGYGDEAELIEAGATYLVKSPKEILDLVLKA